MRISHTGPVWQVSWAHPRFGNILASCGYDRKIIVWKEVRTNEWEKVKDFDQSGSGIVFLFSFCFKNKNEPEKT